MFELTGKYNTATVYAETVDNETISQIMLLLNQQFVQNSKICIMPDTHAGAGCVIGTTMTLHGKVVPNLVGVDIGCGMLATKIREKDVDLEKLDKVIENKIPSGFDIHKRPVVKSNADQIYAPVDVNKAFCSLGTLGGGNHFIELNRAADDSLWLVVHTGSRHMGLEIAKYYQKLAVNTLKSEHIETKIKETIERLKAEGKQRDIENTVKILRMQHQPIPDDLCYLEGNNYDMYIHDMKLAQQHAELNRAVIADTILCEMNLSLTDRFDTIHNYIDTEHMILRKGAISARSGERVLIPMNMRDGSLICVGNGRDDWNQSAPHGAGRVMSRSEAKQNVTLEEFEESMSGIYSTSVCTATIDESPMAYKPMAEIEKCIEPTVNIIDRIVPIYNFKAH